MTIFTISIQTERPELNQMLQNVAFGPALFATHPTVILDISTDSKTSM